QDEVTVAEYLTLYQEHGDAVMTELTILLPDAAETVRHLSLAGYRLAIVSQKLRYRIEEVLRRDGLDTLFGAVLGGGDGLAFTRDPRGILMAVERLGGTTANALFVGDTVIDAEAAKRAGVAFVAVLSGPTQAEEFAGYELLAAIEGVGGLPAVLEAAES